MKSCEKKKNIFFLFSNADKEFNCLIFYGKALKRMSLTLNHGLGILKHQAFFLNTCLLKYSLKIFMRYFFSCNVRQS